jgi:hypothetical protein
MTFDQTVAALEASLAAKDPDYASTRRFHDGTRVAAAVLDERERELEEQYPPSFRDAVIAHGLFSLGKPDPAHDHLVFRCWPPERHRTALIEYAEQLDCEPTAAEVASQIGVDEEHVAALGQVILVGVEGHEDYIGFDLRTRNPKTGECHFGMVLFDDTEIEAFANADTNTCDSRGFDEWLARHIERRA